MSNQYLKLRRSNVPGKIPTTESIDFGEIALNTYDGLAYMKVNGPNGIEVVPIGISSGSFTGDFIGTFSGSFSGSGADLSNIPASAIVGLNLSQISSGSYSASISEAGLLINNRVVAPSFTGSLFGTASWADNVLSTDIIGDLTRIATGSVTASVSPTRFVVESGSNNTLIFDPTDSGGRLTINSTTGVPVMQVIIPASSSNPESAVQLGINTWDTPTNTFGKSGDSFLRSSIHSNGLNIISAPGTSTEDYIRFYAGTQFNVTSHVHIQGSGSTKGFVGIGIETPTAKLHVNNSTISASFLVEDDTNPDATPFVIDNTGSVGIGILTPQTKLHVSGSTPGLVIIDRNSDLNSNIRYKNALASMWAGLAPTQPTAYFGIGPSEDLRNATFVVVSGSGNVGIGTTTPTASLDVSGSGRFTNGLTVTGSLIAPNITGSLFGTASWATNALTASFAPAYLPLTGGTINGNVVLNGTASIAFLNVTIESASVIYSSGSNVFGDSTQDTQTLVGTVLVSGSQSITGSLIVSQGITGSLLGTSSWAVNAITASYVQLAQSASYVLNAVSSSFASTASYVENAQTASNILGGKAPHVPFFITDTTLATSSIYQSGSSTVIINQDAATTANPEALYVWQPSTSSFNVISGKGNLDNYLQLNVQNTNQGPNASSDIVATANNGNESVRYVNMGINNENYSGFLGGPNDAYLYHIGENLWIGNYSNGKNVYFFNSSSTNPLITLTPSNTVDVNTTLNAPDITGSLYGTSSWALNTVSSSHAVNSDFAGYAQTAGTAANGGVTQIVAGSGVSLIPSSGVGAVTVIATGVGGVTILSGSNVTESFVNSSTWAFTHSLGTRTPVISVFDSNYNQVIPQNIELVDTASAIITFPTLESGFAVATVGGVTGNALSSSYSLFATYADTASYYAETDPVFVARSASLATTGSNSFIGTQRVSGSIIVTGSVIVSGSSTFTNIGPAVFSGSVDASGSGRFTDGLEIVSSSGLTFGGGITALNYNGTELRVGSSPTWGTIQMYANGTIKYSHTTTLTTLTNTTINLATTNVQLGGIGVIKYAVNDLQIGSVDTFFTTVTEYVSGSIVGRKYSNGNYYIGSNPVDSGFKLDVSGSGRFTNGLTVTGSLNVSGSTTQTGNNTLIGNTVLSGSINVSGSQTFNGTSTSVGTQIVTGSLLTSGSQVLAGNTTLIGSTTLSGSFEVSGSTILHNSTFIVTGSTFINGTTQITGSTGITGSFSVRDGNIDIVSGSSFTRWGNKLFNYGAFSDYTTQSGSADTAHAIKFNTTDVALGVSLSGSSVMKIENTGIYNFQWSGQANEGAGAAVISIWLRVNGNDVPGSRGDISLASNNAALPAWNYVLPFNANDAVELYWSSTSANTTWTFSPPAINPTRPSTASIIATITQIA